MKVPSPHPMGQGGPGAKSEKAISVIPRPFEISNLESQIDPTGRFVHSLLGLILTCAPKAQRDISPAATPWERDHRNQTPALNGRDPLRVLPLSGRRSMVRGCVPRALPLG